MVVHTILLLLVFTRTFSPVKKENLSLTSSRIICVFRPRDLVVVFCRNVGSWHMEVRLEVVRIELNGREQNPLHVMPFVLKDRVLLGPDSSETIRVCVICKAQTGKLNQPTQSLKKNGKKNSKAPAFILNDREATSVNFWRFLCDFCFCARENGLKQTLEVFLICLFSTDYFCSAVSWTLCG